MGHHYCKFSKYKYKYLITERAVTDPRHKFHRIEWRVDEAERGNVVFFLVSRFYYLYWSNNRRTVFGNLVLRSMFMEMQLFQLVLTFHPLM